MPRTQAGRALFALVVCLLLALIALNLRHKIMRKTISASTPLVQALLAGDNERATTLIAHGANVNSLDPYTRNTPLMAAVSAPHPSAALIQLLLSKGADVNADNTWQGPPLNIVCRRYKQELLAHGANANARQNNGRTVLQIALYYGDLRIVRMLLQHGADVHARGDFNGTPLQTALRLHRPALVKMLRQAGATE
jgi:ankyrin repeat protein